MAVQVIRKSLLDAAEKYKPGASAIHMRLEADHRYMSMMVRLVSKGHFYFSFNVADALCSRGLDFH